MQSHAWRPNDSTPPRMKVHPPLPQDRQPLPQNQHWQDGPLDLVFQQHHVFPSTGIALCGTDGGLAGAVPRSLLIAAIPQALLCTRASSSLFFLRTVKCIFTEMLLSFRRTFVKEMKKLVQLMRSRGCDQLGAPRQDIRRPPPPGPALS